MGMKRTSIMIAGLILFVAIAAAAPASSAAASGNKAPSAKAHALYTAMALKETAPKYEIDVEYPLFGAAFSDKLIEDFIQQESFTIKTMSEEEPLEGEMFYRLSITFEVSRFSDTIMSVRFFVAQFNGGAHDYMYNKCFTFDLASGKQVTLDDLFTDKKAGIDAIHDAVIASLKETHSEEGCDLFVEDLAPSEETYSEFTLYPYDMDFKFAPGVASPYALGQQEATVSLYTLKPYLKKTFIKD